jgi:tRNA(fMet)-specific endonuclease VapC
LDTNICVYFLNGKFDIDKKLAQVGLENCFISIITLAELKFGIANSHENRQEANRQAVESFAKGLVILPLDKALDDFALLKAKFRKEGKPVDNFDLLIGTTALAHNLVLATRNVKHFERIEGLEIENWAEAH